MCPQPSVGEGREQLPKPCQPPVSGLAGFGLTRAAADPLTYRLGVCAGSGKKCGPRQGVACHPIAALLPGKWGSPDNRNAVASGDFEMKEPFGAQLEEYFIHPQLAEKSPAARRTAGSLADFCSLKPRWKPAPAFASGAVSW